MLIMTVFIYRGSKHRELESCILIALSTIKIKFTSPLYLLGGVSIYTHVHTRSLCSVCYVLKRTLYTLSLVPSNLRNSYILI